MNIDDKIIKIINDCCGPEAIVLTEDLYVKVYLGMFGQICQFVEENRYIEKKKKLHVRIVHHPAVNAFACSIDEDNDLIVIFNGAMLSLVTVFGAMLCHPNIFPDIGNPSVEEVERAYLKNGELPNVGTKVVMGQSHKPLDPERQSFAMCLTEWALTYLVLHEAGHLTNGHIELVEKISKERHFLEAVSKKRKIPPYVSQTLEMDADCFAAQQMVNEVFSRMNSIDKKSRDKKNKILYANYGTKEICIKTIWFSVYTFFKLFDQGHGELLWTDNLSHPSPPVRAVIIMDVIRTIFEKNDQYKHDYDPKEFNKHSIEIIVQAENACSVILKQPISPNGVLSVFDNSIYYLEYMDKLFKTWAEIRPDLEQFKRGGNLAPIQEKFK